MKNLSEIDKAWLAGFMDGEGYFGIVRQAKKSGSWLYHPQVVLANSDEKIMNEVQEAIDIGKRAFKSPTVTSKAGYQLKVYKHDDICTLISCIAPYLRVKKTQAVLLQKFCELRKNKTIITGRGSNGKSSFDLQDEEIYLELRKLNKTGVNNI